jgi:hypothetical protein
MFLHAAADRFCRGVQTLQGLFGEMFAVGPNRPRDVGRFVATGPAAAKPPTGCDPQQRHQHRETEFDQPDLHRAAPQRATTEGSEQSEGATQALLDTGRVGISPGGDSREMHH